jgi:hypothetical protein
MLHVPVYKYKHFTLYQRYGMNTAMETHGTPPAVTEFVLAQLRRLGEDVGRLERMTAEHGGGAAVAAALDRLRHRLAAHVVVEERLFVSPLRGCDGYRQLLTLEDEHDALEHRAADVQARGCVAHAVLALGRALRAHIEEERRVVRSASAAGEERLSAIPSWRADELFECSGGPTDTWPGEWLG